MAAVLEVLKLNKSFGSNQVVNDLSFRVEAGDVFGFLGPNGAGKTTTIWMQRTLQDISQQAYLYFLRCIAGVLPDPFR